MAQEQLPLRPSGVSTRATHHLDNRSTKSATTDGPGHHKDTAASTKMALSRPDEQAAEVTAKIEVEIERLEEQTKGMTEEIKLLEEELQRQESQRMALLANKRASRTWITRQMGRAAEDIGRRRSVIEERKASCEGNRRWIAQGRKWQRGIEVAGTLVELDDKIRECLVRIDRERDQLEQLRQEAEQLHNEQREMTIETGGTAWALLSEELQGVERALRESESTRTMIEKEDMAERQRRRAGGWSDCESD